MRTTLRIGTRASLLAVTQSTWVKTRIEQAHPQVRVELVQITTKGDRILDVPLAKVGGKGLFVKEIEDALLDGTADLAVHSMKDVPTELPEGLFIGIVPARETPLDAYISNRFATLEALPVGARVGTSSLRRKSQLAAVRPDFGHSRPARQRRHPSAQARRGSVRGHHPGRRRPQPPRPAGTDHR